MRIVSWNVNSLRARLDHILALLDSEAPDLLALQETKITDPIFPHERFSEVGYHALYSGQKSYNGVAILSREPGEILAHSIPDWQDDERRVLLARYGKLFLLNVYVPNGQTIESDKYRYKLAWLAHLTHWLRQSLLLTEHSCLAVVGDFNIAPTDADVHDPAQWKDSVLVSPPERAALNEITSLGLKDCFRLFDQPHESYSWWDYRRGSFRKNQGLRIDLILATEKLAHLCNACYIEKKYRDIARPSDHAPVIADFSLSLNPG